MYPRILQQIQALVRQGEYVLSVHVENELEDDGFTDQDLEAAIPQRGDRATGKRRYWPT